MKINISFRGLYLRRSLFEYWFREQSEKTLDELINRSNKGFDFVLDTVERYANENNFDVDDIDEMFYHDSVEDIAKNLDIELKEEEEGEEEW